MNPRTPFILVDRAATGGFEIWYDGYPAVVFAKDQVEVTVWGDLIDHIFTHEHDKVYTTDGGRVHRVAVKATAGTTKADLEELVTAYGEDVLDQTPIEIRDPRPLDMAGREYIDLKVPIDELRERLGSSPRVAMQER